MKVLLPVLLILIVLVSGMAQLPIPTNAVERLDAHARRMEKISESFIRNIPFQNVGPTIFSGRVVDIAVNPDKPEEFLLAYASGGLWYTKNNGASFEPIFDTAAVITIGALAVDWRSGTYWVGTGEVNSSRSSYAGIGVYISKDRGKSWTYSGLPESHHIGRIVCHPTNPDIAWVAVMGHLYSDNSDRGIYKTTDGGMSWSHTLFLNDQTGAIDVVIDPLTPEVLYAALWQRKRQAWNFEEAGSGSGIYKSSDGGERWKLISDSTSGFPIGPGCGRIGLSISEKNGQSHLFAVVDNFNARPKKELPADSTLLTADNLQNMSTSKFLSLTDEKLEFYLRKHNFPEKYTALLVKSMVKEAKLKPADLATYTEDANAKLFNTNVIGPEIYRLNLKSDKWERTHSEFLDELFYSYGYYFGQIRSEPGNPDNLYILGVPILRSTDGGKSFESIHRENMHVDHHALWINPKNPDHLLLGNDGGANLTYDQGITWTRINRPPVGQFYAIAVDNAEPFNIYGGLQDNGVWKGPSTYKPSLAWEMKGQYPYEELLGGDGMQVQVDPRENNKTIYAGYQFGNYFRINSNTRDKKSIKPKHEIGEMPYRWNWQTPIHLSVHNPDILYMGAQKLLRSFDKGENFKPISSDLTLGGMTGDIPYGTLSTIHESPMQFGLLYTGSDDGLVHISKDGGFSWQNITKGLPANLWVSRVQASQFVEGRVYVTLNGYRWDHFNAYIFRSDDFGSTWKSLANDLPGESVNVIREDPSSQHILYVGTDHGIYASIDTGGTFHRFEEGLPHVPVHDLAIHKETNTLVAGTHGRSLYIADISLLKELPAIRDKSLHIFAIAETLFDSTWGISHSKWQKPEDPSVSIQLYSNSGGKVQWAVYPEGEKYSLLAGTFELEKGLNFKRIDLKVTEKENVKKWMKSSMWKEFRKKKMVLREDFQYLIPGSYNLEIHLGDDQVQIPLLIK